MAGLSPAAVDALRRPLEPLGADGWIVGGGLRDAAMGREIADVDVALRGDVTSAARALARRYGATRFELSATFGGWRITGGRLPWTVDLIPLVDDSIATDLGRRDLTVNAMALPLAVGELLDPHDGLGDIDRRRLRAVAPGVFREDPVRVMRLVRQAHQLGFSIDPPTADRAREAAPGLAEVSPERVRAELVAILAGPHPPAAIRDLVGGGLFDSVLPELAACRGLEQGPGHHADVLEHTLLVVEHAAALVADPAEVFGTEAPWIAQRLATPLGDGMNRGQGLVLAALVHDVGKPGTARRSRGTISFAGHEAAGAAIVREWCEGLRFSARVCGVVAKLVAVHGEVGRLAAAPIDPTVVHRLFEGAAPVEVELLVHAIADRQGALGGPDPAADVLAGRRLVRDLARMHREMAALIATPLLDGNEIATLAGRAPGPWLGAAVAALREAQAIGRISDRNSAMEFVRTLQ